MTKPKRNRNKFLLSCCLTNILLKLSRAEISVSRQNIMRFLKGYAPIVSMIKDGIHHLSNAILDTKLPSKRKRLLVKLFRECHTCLSNFCYQNENNQVILAKYKELFLSYSGLEVGQFKLLSEIHRNNKKLCEEADKTFLQKFLDVIQTEGRQEKFLDIFEVYTQSANCCMLIYIINIGDTNAKWIL